MILRLRYTKVSIAYISRILLPSDTGRCDGTGQERRCMRDVVAQWVKMFPGIPASHTGVPDLSFGYSVSNLAACEAAEDGSSGSVLPPP